jgi:hypothetical protein
MASGKPAGAEVVLAEPAGGFMRSGISTGDVSVPWNMQLRIVPGDEPPFDLNVKMEVPILMAPTPGMTLQVIYNPKQPEKIIVDPESAPKDKKEALTAQVIESAQAQGLDTTGMQEAADAATDPIAAAAAAAAQMRANVTARSNAQLAASLRARSEALQAQVAAGSPPVATGPEGGHPQSGPPQDMSVEAFKAQLEKLNNLKAIGAIDENEYQAVRQKLIDGL